MRVEGSRPCESRNRQQDQETSRADFQQLQIVRRSRSAERRHVVLHQHYFCVLGGIVLHDDRCSLRVLIQYADKT